MKAIAVRPGQPGSVHLAEVREPQLDDVPGGRGVLVRVLRVGVDGTDKEINAAEYGAAPAGSDVLVLGHESLGRVVAVGRNVKDLAPGDLVVATVRRPGNSVYDLLGMSDFTTDDTYRERGINLLDGFLTERYVESDEFLVRLPESLRETGVLLEPLTIAEKGVTQAFEIQRRLRSWQSRRAAVMGAGTVGLLTALVLRLRGLQVTVFARQERPSINAELVEALGAEYCPTAQVPLLEAARSRGRFDLVFEATGASSVVFDSMQVLAPNGVLVLASVTGGDRQLEIPADRINLEFVLGNRVMVGTVNASREHFEAGVRDLVHADALHPGWLSRLLTHPVRGLENHAQLFSLLTQPPQGAVKTFCVVSEA